MTDEIEVTWEMLSAGVDAFDHYEPDHGVHTAVEQAYRAMFHASEHGPEIERLQRLLQISRGALADIAVSTDMTLTLARKKANRIYEETDPDKKETQT